MRLLARQLVVVCVVAAGLVPMLPAGPAAAIPIFPGNPGNLQVTFNNTGRPGFNTGPAALGVGAFRMDTGAGTGSNAGGKVFLHSSELDDHPLEELETFSYQYFIDPGSASSMSPYPNLRVNNPAFVPPGARTLTVDPEAGVPGQFATFDVPTGDTSGWFVTGTPFTCGGMALPAEFSLNALAAACPGTNIVATSGGLLGGVSVVTGVSDGSGFVGWTGVVDDLRINANQYDLEPAQVTITPASPVALPNRDPQSVAFTLQASGWNSFIGIETGAIPLPIVNGYEMQVGFRATGATSVTGLAGAIPVATELAQLTSPPPPVMFTLDVPAALIGTAASISVDWIAPTGTPTPGVAANATTVPATTLLQLPVTPVPPVPPGPPGVGYTMAASDGGVFNFGAATFQGSVAGLPLEAPIVGVAHRPGGQGYWLVAGDGGVFAMGDAPFFGSAAGTATSAVVGIAPHPGGQGYWVVTEEGQVLGFGAAASFGDATGLTLEAPIVGIASTASGEGYWLFAADGGVFAYGDAGFFGSAGGLVLAQPVVGGAAAADGSGYYLVASDGGVFTYGPGAIFAGSAGAIALNQPVVGMTVDPDGLGYWLAASDGGVFSFGAPFLGSTGHLTLTQPVVGIDAL